MAYYLPWLSNVASSGVVTADIVASTTGGSGIEAAAPLAVHFDGTGTTRTGWDLPTTFRRCTYTWDYGDTNLGTTDQFGNTIPSTWSTGNPANNSRNQDVGGPIAAHVYEKHGTYTVTLTVSDGLGNSHSTTTTITVSNPDTVFSGANTICINDSGTSDGLGPSGCTYQSSMPTAAEMDGKRVLLRRGSSTVRSMPNTTGSLGRYVAAYGTGSKPLITRDTLAGNGTKRTVYIDTNRAPQPGANQYLTAFGGDAASGGNWLLLRADMPVYASETAANNVLFTLSIGQATGSNATLAKFMFAVDCAMIAPVPPPDPANPAFTIAATGQRFAVMGCTMRGSWQHDVRYYLAHKTFTAHNNIEANQGIASGDAFKLHAGGLTTFNETTSSYTANVYESRFNILANNICGTSGRPINIFSKAAPQNPGFAEQVLDTIYENNVFRVINNATEIANASLNLLCVNNLYDFNGALVRATEDANSYPVSVQRNAIITSRST